MRVEEFDYCLPPELVAQEPPPVRTDSRLLILDRKSGLTSEAGFPHIVDLLEPGDLLVLNDTKVIPARLIGAKQSGGKAEVFLSRKLKDPGEAWLCLIRCSKPPRQGSVIILEKGVVATVLEKEGDCWKISFTPVDGFTEWLEKVGSVPLPPYIRRQSLQVDRDRYQTVFASKEGAVAAPTAGLHFTPQLLDALERKGVEILRLTLHVGLGTFLPLRVSELEQHRMHCEAYHIPEVTANAINKGKQRGSRVVAVGTTTVRTLEQATAEDGTVIAGEGEADIFIYPGYSFRTVDAMITNFHLPQSTLLMLVSAFCGKETVLRAYADAAARRFRFFSYGDAMFIA